MDDDTKDTPAAAAAINDKTEKPDAAAKPPEPKKKRNWRRRLIVALVLFIALVVVVRVAIVVAAPRVLASVAGSYGLNASFERLEVHFLAGDVGIWHLNLTPRSGGGDSVLHLDYARAHVAPWPLLLGRIHAYRVEADGINLTVERDKEGNVPLFDAFLTQQTKKQEQVRGGMRPEDVDLTAPLQIDALRVQYVNAHLKDQFVTPAVDATLELNVRVSDVDSEVRPVAYQIDVACPPLLDALRIEGKAKAKGKDLDADMLLTLRGLHPRPAAGYLRPLGIEPRGERIDMTMAGKIDTHGVKLGGSTDPKAPEALAGVIGLKDMKILADDAEAVGVDTLTIDVVGITEGLIDLAKLSIDGVRAKAARTAAGNVAVAGLELVPPVATTPATSPTSKPAGDTLSKVVAAANTVKPADAPVKPDNDEKDPAHAAVAGSAEKAVAAMSQPFAPPPFHARLGELRITNVKAGFDDGAVSPPADLAMVVEQLVVKDIEGDPANPEKPLTFEAALAAPGVAQAITVTGSAKPFSTAAKNVTLSVKVEGIKPEAIRPYLSAAGVESQFAGGTLTADVDATVRPAPGGAAWEADATVGKVVLHDGEDLLALDNLKVTGARLLPDGTIRIDELQGAGPTVSAKRDKEGRFVALGIRTGATPPPAANKVAQPTPAAPVAQPTAPPTTAPSTATAVALPKIEVGKLTWGGVKVKLTDEMISPASSFELEDVTVEVTDFRTTPDPTGQAKPGKVLFALRSPQLAKKLAVTGSIVPKADGVSFDLNVDGEGIRSADIAPYVAGTGIEPTLKDATLKLGAKVDLTTVGDRSTATLAVSNFTYGDEGKELVGVDSLKVDDVELTSAGVTIGSVELEKPRAIAARDADGALRAAGVRIPPPPPPATQPTEPQKVAAAPPAAPTATLPAAAPATPQSTFVAALKKLIISGGSLSWSDHAVSPAVEQTAGADVELTGLVIGDPKAAPAQLKLKASAKPALDEATVNGTVSLLPTSQGATLEIAARGIREGVLAPYLPPGLRVALKDGRFRTKIDAAVGDAAKGGRQAKLAVTALDYRDGNAKEPLLALDAFRVKVDRLDIPAHVVALDEITLSGLETGAEQDASGTLKSLGLLVGKPVDAAKKGQPAPATAPAAATRPATANAVAKAAAPASTQPATATQPVATDVATLLAAAHQPMPLVTLNKLDLGIKRAFFKNGATPGAAPIVLSNLRVRNKQRIELLGDENATHPPAEIETAFAVEPLAKDVRINTRLASAGPQTDVHVDVAASGVRGQGVTDLLPQLKASLDGTGMTDGSFAATVEASLKMQARALVEMDFTKSVELDLLVNNVAFKQAPNSPTLVGVEEVRSEGIKFDPQTGNLHAKSIDITKPIAHAYNDKDGLHALGLVLKPAPAASATQPATAPAAAPPASQPVVVATTQPAEAGAEVKVDRLTISGLDASYEDRTTDPVTLVPLTGLDVEVRGFTTRAFTQEIPVTFSATVSAGKVPLPPRQTTGLAAGVMNMLGGGNKAESSASADAANLEQRDLFSQITADGRVSLYPKPKGWAKTSVSGFELTGVRGMAKAFNVNIGNGTLDNTVDARMAGDGAIALKTKSVFTDLRMTEPPNGLIQKFLLLPAPIDFVIGALEDPAGGITLTPPITIKDGDLSGVGPAIGGQILPVLGTAGVSSGVKAVQGAGDIVAGIGGATGLSKYLPFLAKKEQAPPGPLETSFFPGDASVGFDSGAQVREIAERLRKDATLQVTLKHRMSAADVAAAQQRANPSTDEAADIAYQLRTRKLQRASDRAVLAGRARAELASSLPGATVSQTVEQLRSLDREAAETEAALDQVYDLLRPGADRAAPRRTRAAAIAIGNARLEAVKASLVLAGVTDAANRIRVTPAKFEPDAELSDPAAGGRVVMTTGRAAK